MVVVAMLLRMRSSMVVRTLTSPGLKPLKSRLVTRPNTGASRGTSACPAGVSVIRTERRSCGFGCRSIRCLASRRSASLVMPAVSVPRRLMSWLGLYRCRLACSSSAACCAVRPSGASWRSSAVARSRAARCRSGPAPRARAGVISQIYQPGHLLSRQLICWVVGLHVVIIGAGIGGLGLAQGLRKAGISATVYERDESAGFRHQGYRVSLKAAGAGALRECLPANLFDLAAATSIRAATRMVFLDEQLRPKFGKPLHHDPPGPGGFGVNRLTLREILL